MTDYTPPTEELPIFDKLVFSSGDEALTYNKAKKLFLRYPNAQGTENLQAINVNGIATFNNDIIANDKATFNSNITANLGADVYTTSSNTLAIYDKNNIANNTKIYQSAGVFDIINSVNNGVVYVNLKDSSGTASNRLTLSKASTTLQTDAITMTSTTGTIVQANNINATPTFSVKDTSSNQSIYFMPKTTAGSYNYLDTTSAQEIIAYGTAGINTQTLIIASHSTTSCGVKITPTTVLIGSGGTSSTPTNYFQSSSTSNTIAGTTSFTSTNPPTSSQIIPASNDSSNKIPTTAWVQSAISGAVPNLFVPKFVNYTDIQSNVSIGYSNGPRINFNGTWAENDIAIFRIIGQISYNPDGSGAYQSTSNTSGTILFRPYYMYNGWGGNTTNLVNYTSNTPSSVCGADRHICYYTPSYNIGNTSFFNLVGGVGNAQFNCLSQGNPSSWTYMISIEYMMIRSTSGTVSFTNGTDPNGINNLLK